MSQDIVFHPYIADLLQKAFANPSPPFAEQTLAQVRATRDQAITTLMGPGEEVARVEDRRVPVTGGEIALRLYFPSHKRPLPVMVWFHGGGWVLGSLATHDGPCRALANLSGHCIASVDYRLAPEHKFPTGVHDCLAATRWVAENGSGLGLDPANLSIGGDSAGGGLAFGVALLARDQGGPAISRMIAAYPAVDLTTFDTPSFKKYWDKVILDGPAVDYYRTQYLKGPADAADPLASPLLATDLSGLPPCLVVTAEHDVLTSEGEAMAQRLRQSGVNTEYVCFPGMIHLFFGMGRLTNEENGLALAARFMAG